FLGGVAPCLERSLDACVIRGGDFHLWALLFLCTAVDGARFRLQLLGSAPTTDQLERDALAVVAAPGPPFRDEFLDDHFIRGPARCPAGADKSALAPRLVLTGPSVAAYEPEGKVFSTVFHCTRSPLSGLPQRIHY